MVGIETIAMTKVLEGLGKFFGKICLPAADEFGLLLKDKIAFYRLKNLAEITRKAESIIQKNGILISGQGNPKLLKEVIEEGSWDEDSGIQSMWAGLIAESVNDVYSESDGFMYMRLLKNLTPFQARLIRNIYTDPRCYSLTKPFNYTDRCFYPDTPIVVSVMHLLGCTERPLVSILGYDNEKAEKELQCSPEETAQKILESPAHHSMILDSLKPQVELLRSHGLLFDILYKNNEIEFVPSIQGLTFFIRCEGSSLPPEADMAIQKHAHEKQGVDVFNISKDEITYTLKGVLVKRPL